MSDQGVTAMETTRLKLKIGPHEFEAEGPAETVKEQFEAFKELVKANPSPSPITEIVSNSQSTVTKENMATKIETNLDSIMSVAGRLVSLTALPSSIEDAALLILLGQKELRGNTSATAQEVGDGLAQSGRPVPRVDRIMESALRDAMVIKTGVKRSTRYRLTNQGFAKALGLARDLRMALP
jgi:predicted LPLAT superfamily acyltransferase